MLYNNIKYTRQRFKSDCCPALIANIIKWKGLSFNYTNEYYALCEMLDCDPQVGTLTENMIEYFKVATIVKSVYKEDPLLQDIDQHLSTKGAVAFFYDYDNKGSRHAALIIKGTKKNYYFVNHSKKSTLSEISLNAMKRFMSKKTYAFFIHV